MVRRRVASIISLACLLGNVIGSTAYALTPDGTPQSSLGEGAGNTVGYDNIFKQLSKEVSSLKFGKESNDLLQKLREISDNRKYLLYDPIMNISTSSSLDDIEKAFLDAGIIANVKPGEKKTIKAGLTYNNVVGTDELGFVISYGPLSDDSAVTDLKSKEDDVIKVCTDNNIRSSKYDVSEMGNRTSFAPVIYTTNKRIILRLYVVVTGDLLFTERGIIEKDITDIVKYIQDNYDKVKPCTKAFIDSLHNVKESSRDGMQKKQSGIWDLYSNNTSSISESRDWTIEFNEHVMGEDIANPPSLDKLYNQPGSNPLRAVYGYSYVAAVEESGIYDIDYLNKLGISTITDGKVDISSSTSPKIVSKVDVIAAANAIVNEFNTKLPEATSINEQSNAFMFEKVAKYYLGKVANPTYVTSEVVNASDVLKDSDRCNNLLYHKEDLRNTLIEPDLWIQIQTMKLPSGVIDIDALIGLMTQTQKLSEYTSNKALSGLEIKNDVVINQEMEDMINKDKADGKTKEDLRPLTDNMAKWAAEYKSITNGLAYLGIEPWTEELKYIKNLAENELVNYPISEDFDPYSDSSDTEPLKAFFTIGTEGDNRLSTNYLTGVALSSSYIPLRTNVYDPVSVRILKNDKWLTDFHIKYGFHRKALLIDNNVNAAVDGYITKSKDSQRVATLNDLLSSERDIVLYIDDNFYNTDEVAKVTERAYNRLVNTESSGKSGMNSTDANGDPAKRGGLFSASIEEILKTGPVNVYSEKVKDTATQYGTERNIFGKLAEVVFNDDILLSGSPSNNEIKSELNKVDYSPMQSYAVVSGIYRDRNLADLLNREARNQPPVFVSSPSLFNVDGISSKEFSSFYNYLMIRNLEKSLGVDYRTSLDLDNPIYMDIYGNILTESGLVVIPAASNATLYPGGVYSPYTIGMMELYSNGNFYDKYTDNIKSFAVDFIWEEENSRLLQKNYEINGVPANPMSPSVSSSDLVEVLYDNQVSMLANKAYDLDQRIWLITEVLRGAPIESINKEKEGLSGKRDVSKYGLFMSWKLDDIANMILPTTNGNSIISMPNLSFMKGIEYFVFLLYKIIIICCVVYILYQIYLDTVGGLLGLSTLWRVMSTISVFLLSLFLLNTAVRTSYNESNKILLQNEVKYINLMNYEKSLEGREISAVGVDEPQSKTELYLKLDKVKVKWYKVFEHIMFSSISDTISDMYNEALEDNYLYGFTDTKVVEDGVYISVDDVFNSSTIIYNNQMKFLYQNINVTPTASYFMPYYYMVDALLANVNEYNKSSGLDNITTKVQFDGSVKTMGMIGDYLLSEYFMVQQQDPLRLYELYGIDVLKKTKIPGVPDDDVDNKTKQSMWYVKDHYKDKEITDRIDQLYSSMRSFVAKNRDMIGRVTDESFVKVMVLDAAIKYNNLFRIPSCRSVEIFNVDSRDIIRLSITDKATSIVNSTDSFGKFVYEQAGGLGVILTAVLLGVYFISSIVKPVMIIVMVLLLIWNLVVRNMFRGERGKTVEGVVYTFSVLVIVNCIYALLLKLSTILPNFGMNPTISIIGQIFIQVFYLVVAYLIVRIIFKDSYNFGYSFYTRAAESAINSVSGIKNRFGYTDEQRAWMSSASTNNNRIEENNSDDLLSEMRRRDKVREDSDEYHAFFEEYHGPHRQVHEDDESNK